MAHILVIEDNPANLKLTRVILERANYIVTAAENAHDGLAAARTVKPDAILMDIQLPDMDGLQATSLLKADPATASIPVVALTAFAMKGGEEAHILAAGCDAYMSKPFRYADLLDLVEQLVGTSSLPRNVS